MSKGSNIQDQALLTTHFSYIVIREQCAEISASNLN
jgi:hypothetical protein